MGVRVIKATRPQTTTVTAARKLRVAAYCRVSTDMEEQESSYEVQCSHYTAYILSNPDWEPAGIFADEGISGTSTKGRTRFNEMIAACETGEIDMVITKSISRFARNTLDCLTYIRKLKALGIPILFEKENINTMDARGELLLTIMASIAQQESQSISQNVRLGIQYRMQEGKGRLDTTRFLGLTKENGKLVIVPGEAETVRRIYREYLDGFSPEMIAKRLSADGVAAPRGGAKWYQSTVASILANEKYCGDLLLQKYYTVDFLTHRIAKNTGQFPQYFVEDDHEPIIPKPVYFQVQGELLRRGALKNDPSKLRFGSVMALSGRLICGKCGNVLKRFTKQDGRETDWRCRRRAGMQKAHQRDIRSACGCRFVPARAAVVEAFNRLAAHRGALERTEDQILRTELVRIDARLDTVRAAQEDIETHLERPEAEPSPACQHLREELERLQEDRIALALERAERCRRVLDIRLTLELLENMAAGGGGTDAGPYAPACRDYAEFFRRTRYALPAGVVDKAGRMVRFDDSLVIRYITGITVTDEGFDVHFKAGVTIRVEAGMTGAVPM